MNLDGECSSTMDSGDCSWNPSWCTGLTGTTVQSVAGSANVVRCTDVLNCCLFLLLALGGFTGLIFLGDVCWRWQQSIYLGT